MASLARSHATCQAFVLSCSSCMCKEKSSANQGNYLINWGHELPKLIKLHDSLSMPQCDCSMCHGVMDCSEKVQLAVQLASQLVFTPTPIIINWNLRSITRLPAHINIKLNRESGSMGMRKGWVWGAVTETGPSSVSIFSFTLYRRTNISTRGREGRVECMQRINRQKERHSLFLHLVIWIT